MSIELDKINLFNNILGSFYKTSEEHLFFCPFCKHKKRKLSINFKKGVFKCWICEQTGGLKYLVQRFGSPQHRTQWAKLSGDGDMTEKSDLADLLRGVKPEPPPESCPLPPEFRTLVSNKQDILAVPALRYLYGRGITKEDIFTWRMGYAMRGDYAGKIIIPSFAPNGKVNYFVARSYLDEWLKYKNPVRPKTDFIFNELNINFRKPIVLTEGVFDAIIAGKNAIPLLGSSFNRKSKLFFELVKNNSTVFVALDADAEEKEAKVISTLLEYNLTVNRIVVAGYKDVGEMGKKEFQRRLAEATSINKQVLLSWKLIRGFNK